MLQRLLPALVVCAIAGTAAAQDTAAPAAGFDLQRPEIRAFVDEQVKDGADRQQLLDLLARAVPQPRIIEAISRPAEKALQWWEYRARFLTDERIAAGVALWREQRALLDSTSQRFRVSPQYLLAIIGVETYYGRITGRYRVLDALATLAFDYPPRATFFRSELAQFLRLAREESLDVNGALGSYAGAMGVAQFMPSSYRRYAVDGGSQPGRDLWNDWSDVFSSVANYLREHGWQYGGPVLSEARYAGEEPAPAIDGFALNSTLGALRTRGFRIDFGGTDDVPAGPILATQADGTAYRIAFQNFQVITRYNRSPLYAMAVSDLADAIYVRYFEDFAWP